jgi:hypothetical protein
MSCTRLYNSKKVQSYLKKTFRKNANQMITEMGGLPEFYYRDFKKGFKRGFMETCKTKKIKHVTRR